MRRERAGEHPPFFLHNYWIRVLCPSISRRWQFPTLRDPPLHSAIRVLIKHDNLIFRLIRTKVLPFSFPLVRSSYNRIITRFACAANPTTTIYTKFSKRVRTHDQKNTRVKISARKLNSTMLATHKFQSAQLYLSSYLYNYPVIHRVGPP